jgi:hypothetical protein
MEAFQADALSPNHFLLTHADVAILSADSFTFHSNSNTYSLFYPWVFDYGSSDNLCLDERFYGQSNPATCSGNTVLTKYVAPEKGWGQLQRNGCNFFKMQQRNICILGRGLKSTKSQVIKTAHKDSP